MNSFILRKMNELILFGSDVTSTPDPEMQELELKVLRKNFARVLTLEEVIEAL